jgi:shikimate dehydrogenase
LGEGRLNLELDSLRFWYGRWPTPNPPRIRLIREAEVRGCIVLDGLGMLVSQGCSVIFMKPWGIFSRLLKGASLNG